MRVDPELVLAFYPVGFADRLVWKNRRECNTIVQEMQRRLFETDRFKEKITAQRAISRK